MPVAPFRLILFKPVQAARRFNLASQTVTSHLSQIHHLVLPGKHRFITGPYVTALADCLPSHWHDPQSKNVTGWLDKFARTEEAAGIMATTERRLERLVDYYATIGAGALDAHDVTRIFDRGISPTTARRWIEAYHNQPPKGVETMPPIDQLDATAVRGLYHWVRPEITAPALPGPAAPLPQGEQINTVPGLGSQLPSV